MSSASAPDNSIQTFCCFLIPSRLRDQWGDMFAIPDGTFTLVDPDDIARVGAEALDALNFKGHSHVYVISDLSGTDEIASLIGKEIGIPDLKWVKFPAEGFKKVHEVAEPARCADPPPDGRAAPRGI